MAAKLVKHELMGAAIKVAFEAWANRDKIYKKHYSNLTANGLNLIYDGLSEIAEYKPYYFDVWWLKNHIRYRKLVRNEELRIIVQMVFSFLGAYSSGKLSHAENDLPKAKAKRKKTSRSL